VITRNTNLADRLRKAIHQSHELDERVVHASIADHTAPACAGRSILRTGSTNGQIGCSCFLLNRYPLFWLPTPDSICLISCIWFCVFLLFDLRYHTPKRQSQTMAPGSKHADHDYIVARQERYIEAWRSGSPENVMEFMDKDDFNYSNFGQQSLLCITHTFTSPSDHDSCRNSAGGHVSLRRDRPI
jgi:hypothetical protein